MTSILDNISRVLMTAVSSTTKTRRPNDSDIRKWVETEYKGDPYAYYCLINNIKPNPRDF